MKSEKNVHIIREGERESAGASKSVIVLFNWKWNKNDTEPTKKQRTVCATAVRRKRKERETGRRGRIYTLFDQMVFQLINIYCECIFYLNTHTHTNTLRDSPNMVISCKQCRSSVLFITMQIVWELFTQFFLYRSSFCSIVCSLVRSFSSFSIFLSSVPSSDAFAYCSLMYLYMNTMFAAIVYHFNNNNNNNNRMELRARNREKNFITIWAIRIYSIYDRYTMKATDNCLICCRCCSFGTSSNTIQCVHLGG